MTGVAMIGTVGSGGAGGGGGSGSGSGGGFTVTIPSSVYGSASGAASSGAVTAGPATAVMGGGTAPFIHSWSQVSGDPAISIVGPTTVNPDFQATVSTATTPRHGVFKDTVTDSFGRVSDSNTTTVSLDWIDTR